MSEPILTVDHLVKSYDGQTNILDNVSFGVQPGEVIVEVGQEAVSTPAEVTKRVEALKKDGRKVAQLLIANPAGELRFVSLAIDE